mmetsp:Transcript_6715/g.15363  ORF Transcript_6715/g.15363 Transcript_6715/m.15363 type:complete len:209 (-) Transcript_6715:923-1549(-)
MPAVGSSRTTNLDPPQTAMATDSLRRCPPESSLPRWSRRSSRWKSVVSSALSLFASSYEAPLSCAKNRMCSRTVRLSKSTSCCGQMPSDPRTDSISVRMSDPYTCAPLSPMEKSGAMRPVSMEMQVVLPAPLCPSRANIWFSYMLKDRSFTDTCEPKVLRSLFTTTVGAPSSSSLAASVGVPAGTTPSSSASAGGRAAGWAEWDLGNQ